MSSRLRWIALLVTGSALVATTSWWASARAVSPSERSLAPASTATPVRTAPIERGSLAATRTFTGTVEARAEVVVMPEIAGLVEKVTVDLADAIQPGQLLVQLDDRALRQAVAEARAELAVARAESTAAEHSRALATREARRLTDLATRGVVSEEEVDRADGRRLQADADVDVAASHVARAGANLEARRLEADRARIVARWHHDDQPWFVAARYVDEGERVTPTTPLLSLVDLDPIVVAISVAEADYVALEVGQVVDLQTDAHPGQTFVGTVERIAPAFDTRSGQARIEIVAPNPDRKLKPGMFARARTTLSEVTQATLVPRSAVVERDGAPVVFVVAPDGRHVSLRPVTIGITTTERIEIHGDDLDGEVVTLGHEGLEDGSEISIPSRPASRDPLAS